ncbi:citrate (Si)-synthase [Chloroflexota bacterium]
MSLHDKIQAQLPEWRNKVKKLIEEKGDAVIDKVTVRQVYGGMRSNKVLVSDISYVDPAEGIRFRGYSIPEVLEKLPKPKSAEMPYVGGLYYLLLTGDIPSIEDALLVEREWLNRSKVPGYVYETLKALPDYTHPMTLFTLAVQSLQTQSEFSKRYHEGMKKDDYWEPMLEDSLNLTAKLPVIAAFIYNLKYRKSEIPQVDPNLDWGANFAQMMGIKIKGYEELSRLYFIIHSDHESGNVSAHATHLVGSSLADIYYALSAGLNGLAGPLHGLASQECLSWLLKVRKEFGGVPDKKQLREFAWKTLEEGKVIPGYGHAVLRVPDPRFSAQMKFAKAHFPEDELVRLAELVFEVVPQVLKDQGKAKNPAPNVDAISGTLQYYFGIKEFDFYTVLFGIGRALGVSSNLVWSRALGQPIERPKSVTTQMLSEAKELN